MCISPISIPRVGGRGSADRLTVPCGRCYECLSRKRDSWSVRLEEELRHSSSAYFVTLTYDDSFLPRNHLGIPTFDKPGFQLFMKRLRKETDNKLRYYAVSEYGSKTWRPHYHMILFNLAPNQEHATTMILKAWKVGHVKVGSVTPASIAYVTKYVITKEDIPDGFDPPFALMSRRPGIGAQYVDRMRLWHDEDDRFYVPGTGGKKRAMPRFYQERLYSKEARENRASTLLSQPVEEVDGRTDVLRKQQLAEKFRLKISKMSKF